MHTHENVAGYTCQGYVAATCPLVSADTFIIVQHQFWVDVVPATCPIKFNLFNFTYLWEMYPQHFHASAHVVILTPLRFPATLPCYMSPQCALRKFFVAATWPCNMSPQHDPPCLSTLKALSLHCLCPSSLTLNERFASTLIDMGLLTTRFGHHALT